MDRFGGFCTKMDPIYVKLHFEALRILGPNFDIPSEFGPNLSIELGASKRKSSGSQSSPKHPWQGFWEIRRPLSGVLEFLNIRWEFTSPYPLRPGTPPAEVWSQFVHSHSIAILGPYLMSFPNNHAPPSPSELWLPFDPLLELK